MPNVADLKVVITVDDKPFQDRMKRVDAALRKFSAGFQSAGRAVEETGRRMSDFGGLLTRSVTLPLTAAAVAVGALGKKAFDLAVSMDALEKGLTSMSGSAKQAAREVATLRKLATTVPGLDFQSAVKGALRLRAAGVEAKLTAETLEALARANAVAGGGTEQFSGALLQLSQVVSSGFLQGDELRIITEHIATFGQFIRETFKATPQEIGEAMKAGKISMQDFLGAFVAWSQGLQVPANSVQNLLTRMRNEVNIALADIGKDFLPDLLELIPLVMRAFKDATPAIKELFRALADVGVPVFRQFIQAATDLLKWFANLTPATQQFIVKALGISALAGPVVSAAGAFVQLFGGLLKVTGLGPIIVAFTIRVATAFRTMAVAIATSLGPVGAIVTGVIALLGTLKLKLDEIDRANNERLAIERNSEALATWINGIKNNAKHGISGLEKIAEAFRKMNLVATENSDALVIQKYLNGFLKKYGKFMDEVGNINNIAEGNNEAISESFEDMAKRMQAAIAGSGDDAEKAAKAWKRLMEAYSDSLGDLRQQIFMIGRTGEAWRVTWEIENGRFKALSQNQKEVLLGLAKEFDAKQRIAEINDILDSEQGNRQWLTFAGGEGLMTPLEMARGKVESLKGAIQELFGRGDVDALAKLPKLFSFLDSALSKLKTEEVKDFLSGRAWQESIENVKALGVEVVRVIGLMGAALGSVGRDFISMSPFANLPFIMDAVRKAFDAAAPIVEKVSKQHENFAKYVQDLNIQLLRLTKGEGAATKAALMLNDALTGDQAEEIMRMQQLISHLEKIKQTSQEWAEAFTDSFLNGLRRIREEGFAGLLRSFEEMLFDMAMAFLRSQLVNMLTSFFSNLLGAAIGGGGGGINTNGPGLPGGQTQTGGGDFGGSMAHVVNNFYITTPDANSFRQSSAQQQIAALQLATANAMRTR